MLNLWASLLLNAFCCLAANNTVLTATTVNGSTLNGTNTTRLGGESSHKKQRSRQIYGNGTLQVIYWEVKPFLFTNKKGEIDGIIPLIFEQARVFCNRRQPFVKYTSAMDSRKTFYDVVRSNLSYGEGWLSDAIPHNAFWAPVLSSANSKDDEFLKRRNIKSFQILKSNEISVIVRRDLVSLPNKIFRGIMACEQIFVLAILLAILFGIILWVIERYQNKDFPESFTKGVAVGLYWSIVSMTTVGYGDIQPMTAVGRFITCFWLFIGVMIGCVMTATMTDVVTGIDLTVQHKRVSVLENSFEEKSAANQYRAEVVPARSYEEVLEMVRKKEVFAAMMNSDVASWYHDIIGDDSVEVPLRMVKKLPANLYVHCFLPSNLVNEVKEIFKCMYYQKDEVYTFSKETFRMHHEPETLYIGSTADLMSTNLSVRVLIGALGVILVLGIAYDIWKYVHKKQKKAGKQNASETQMIQF